MIAGLFRPRAFLDEDLEAWTLEAWAWLMRNLGGMSSIAETPLVQPNRDFFPPSDAEGHARAVHVFGCVKAAMGMGDWPVDLVSFKRRGNAPLGRFVWKDDDVVVFYAEDLLDSPGDLVAVLAHELSHYAVATIKEPWPGGDELNELITEMTVAYAGFGGFAANAAFDLSGNGGRGGGYLSKRTWAFALAIFLSLRGEGIDLVERWLKIDITGDTRAALAYLKKKPELLAPLRAIP